MLQPFVRRVRLTWKKPSGTTFGSTKGPGTIKSHPSVAESGLPSSIVGVSQTWRRLKVQFRVPVPDSSLPPLLLSVADGLIRVLC